MTRNDLVQLKTKSLAESVSWRACQQHLLAGKKKAPMDQCDRVAPGKACRRKDCL